MPDLPGHGASAKPLGDYSLGAHAATLRDLLDELDIPEATIVGHSLGGGVAMQFDYLFPSRSRRVALVSSGGLGREVSLALRAATLPGSELVLPLLASGPVDRVVSAVGARLGRVADLFQQRPRADVRQAWSGIQSLADPRARRAFLATARSVLDIGGQIVSAEPHLDRLDRLPVLIVWGSADRIIPLSHAYAAHERLAGSELHVFAGAGHFPHLDEPARFTQILARFCTEALPA